MAADLERLLDREGLDRAAIVGHSMGGKAAMALALLRPGRVTRLGVVDVAPVDYGHRVFLDYIRAMQGLDLAALGRRAAVDEALAVTVPEPSIRAFLLQNLSVTGHGLSWHPHLAALAHEMPAITGFPDDLLERSYDGPTLVLRGGRSEYVTDLHLPRIREMFPRVTIETVPNAGHWVHAEAPQRVIQDLERFLEA
jgi:pimeloyl-ACP methyl ester carboxylesterase